MLHLVDGPCQGIYRVKRAPVFLRAVVKRVLKPRLSAGEEGILMTEVDGETDVLDQLEDTPADEENVFVYQRDGGAGMVHINARKDGKNLSGYYAFGIYRYLPDVDGEKLRDNPTWQAWASSRLEASNDKA